jgi:hypothetical protein
MALTRAIFRWFAVEDQWLLLRGMLVPRLPEDLCSGPSKELDQEVRDRGHNVSATAATSICSSSVHFLEFIVDIVSSWTRHN